MSDEETTDRDHSRNSKVRYFKCIVRNVRVVNTGQRMDPFLRFTLGGDVIVEDLRAEGKGVVRAVKRKGKTWMTKHVNALSPGEAASFPRSEKTKYWAGSYVDLKKEYLMVEVGQWARFNKQDYRGHLRVPLHQVAGGSVQQSWELVHQRGQKRSSPVTVQFLCYFQEIFSFKLHFCQWQGSQLRAMDADGTSDPYITFRLGDGGSPLQFWKNRGRSCKSDKIMNTLFPMWEDVGIIRFHGTWSELEDEILKIKVYDWDRLQLDDELGDMSIPLRGIIDYGYLKTELAFLDDEDGEQRIVSSGTVQGSIELAEKPMYRQFGDVVKLRSGTRYLCVKIIEAANLIPVGSDTVNPFFSVEWDGCKQATKVIHASTDPHYEETLYFPVRIITLNEREIAKKGNVKIRCFDFSDSGHNFLGSAEIPLASILGPAVRVQKRGEVKTRVCTETTDLRSGNDTLSSVTFSSWFQPDLTGVVLRDRVEGMERDMPTEYKEREIGWRNAIPKHILSMGEFPAAMRDEEGNNHFLCTYLTRMQTPRNFTSRHVLRMMHCITFAADSESMATSVKTWSSPNFFIEMKKGDAEDHAILACNMMLGLGMDAFLAYGKAKTGEEHVWVMTREYNGAVRFWETTTGRMYELAERWAGATGDEDMVDGIDIVFAEQEEARKAAAAKEKKKKKKHDSDDEAEGEFDARGRRRGTLMERRAKAKAERDAAAKRKRVLNVRDKDPDTVTQEIDFSRSLRDRTFKEESLIFFDSDVVLGANGTIDDVMDDMEEEEGAAVPPPNVPFPDLEVAFDLPRARVPYRSLEVIFNNENLWANLQHPDPTKIVFDLDDPSKWNAFISADANFTPEPPSPFYGEARRLGPKLPPERVEVVRMNVMEELMAGLTQARHALNMKTSFYKKLTPVLQDGLKIYEQMKVCASHQVRLMENRLAYWKGVLMQECPPSHMFTGMPVSFSYTDAKRIRKHLLEHYHLHRETLDSAQFVVGVHVTPYPNSVCSVWVFFGRIMPKLSASVL